MSYSFINIIANRSETGPLISKEKFDLKIVNKTLLDIEKKIDIKYTTDSYPIGKDLAKDIWNAGIEFFTETGIFLSNNRRRIIFSREEINVALKHQPSQILVGSGRELKPIYSKTMNSSSRPIIFGGSFNTDIEESLFIKFNMAYAQERLIDVLYDPGQICRVNNVDVRIDSITEMQAVIRRASMTREALRRAGRPDMPVITQSASFCRRASFGPEWGFRKTDIYSFPIMSPLTVYDSMLANIAYFSNYGVPLYISSVPLIGGYGGGPVTTSILSVAEHIAGMMLGASLMHVGTQHIHFGQQSNHQSLWTTLLTNQAITQNSTLIHLNSVIPAARPGDPQYFTEIAAQTLTAIITGSHVAGPRTAKLARMNQNTPLAARFMAETAHAVDQLTMNQALEIIDSLYSSYKNTQKLDQVSEGNVFEELYDLNTLCPISSHFQQYQNIKDRIQDLGLSLREK